MISSLNGTQLSQLVGAAVGQRNLTTGSGFTYKMIPGKDAKHGSRAA